MTILHGHSKGSVWTHPKERDLNPWCNGFRKNSPGVFHMMNSIILRSSSLNRRNLEKKMPCFWGPKQAGFKPTILGGKPLGQPSLGLQSSRLRQGTIVPFVLHTDGAPVDPQQRWGLVDMDFLSSAFSFPPCFQAHNFRRNCLRKFGFLCIL